MRAEGTKNSQNRARRAFFVEGDTWQFASIEPWTNASLMEMNPEVQFEALTFAVDAQSRRT